MMQISELLKKHQLSDIRAIDVNSNTVLHLVVKDEIFTSKETIEILGILLDECLDPNAKNQKDETLMHLAIASGKNDVIEHLLTRNVHLDDSAAFHLIENESRKMSEWEKQQISDIERQQKENESANFVGWIMSNGLNIDCLNSYGRSALEMAFESELHHILPTLLMYTTNIGYVENESGRTWLHIFVDSIAFSREFYESSPGKSRFDCARRYAASVVKMMLDRGISLELADVRGNTALHLALKKGLISIIEMLIETSTNVNQKDSDGNTPLNEAILQLCLSRRESKIDDYIKISRLLLAKDADINEPDESGFRPLSRAVRYHHLQAVEFLRENGADFSVTTENGRSLLHLCAKKSFNVNRIDNEAKTKLLSMLISNGCQVNAKDGSGNTPLHTAATKDDVTMVKMLIEHGAEIDARNNKNETPLCHLATYNTETAVAELLLQHGANIDARDFDGFTALHMTASGIRVSREKEMLHFLLKHGANFNARVDAGHTVVRVALWRDYNEDENFEVEPLELPSLARCMQVYVSGEREFLLKHRIKLHVADLKCHTGDDYESLVEKTKYIKYREKCLEEIKTLKNTFIDSRTSLYTLLHMNPNNRRAYIYNEKLQQLVQSSKLEEQFPEFAVLICSSYHEAVARKLLLEPAKTAWLELTKISLPEECLEVIFSFLSNSELFDFIGKN